MKRRPERSRTHGQRWRSRWSVAFGVVVLSVGIGALSPLTAQTAASKPSDDGSEEIGTSGDAAPGSKRSAMAPGAISGYVDAPERSIEVEVRYQTIDGLFVDLGSVAGVRAGLLGSVEENGRVLGRFEVVYVSRSSAFLRPEFSIPEKWASGLVITLNFDEPLVAPETTDEDGPRYQDTRGFTPLLADPPGMGNAGVTDARNVVAGRLSARQLFQSTTEDDLDYLRTHVSTSGSVQRLDGTPWAIEWGGELIYRSGDGYEDLDDYQELDPELYQFSLFRRFDDKAMVRIGRFLPRELPSVGYVDGIQLETPTGSAWRTGVVFGFKPTRDDLEPTLRELVLVPYATIEGGDGVEQHYSMTAGLMATLYEWEPDRLGLLIDQTARLGRFQLYSSSEVDVDIGGFETRDVARLTRWNLSTSWAETWFGTLRAGLDHFELPDIEAERDLVDEIVLDESAYFNDGFWRYWLGANQSLGSGWTVREEVSYTHGEGGDGMRWLAGVTGRGWFGSDRASVSLDVYNLLGDDVEGYGGRLSAFVPVSETSVYVQPSVAVRSVETDLTNDQLDVIDISLRGHWVISPSWRMTGGASYAITDDFDRILVDVGVTLTW